MLTKEKISSKIAMEGVLTLLITLPLLIISAITLFNSVRNLALMTYVPGSKTGLYSSNYNLPDTFNFKAGYVIPLSDSDYTIHAWGNDDSNAVIPRLLIYKKSSGIWNDRSDLLTAIPTSFIPLAGYYVPLSGTYRIHLFGQDSNNKLKFFAYNPDKNIWIDQTASAISSTSTEGLIPATFKPSFGRIEIKNSQYSINLYGQDSISSNPIVFVLNNYSNDPAAKWQKNLTSLPINFKPITIYPNSTMVGGKLLLLGDLNGKITVYSQNDTGNTSSTQWSNPITSAINFLENDLPPGSNPKITGAIQSSSLEGQHLIIKLTANPFLGKKIFFSNNATTSGTWGMRDTINITAKPTTIYRWTPFTLGWSILSFNSQNMYDVFLTDSNGTDYKIAEKISPKNLLIKFFKSAEIFVEDNIPAGNNYRFKICTVNGRACFLDSSPITLNEERLATNHNKNIVFESSVSNNETGEQTIACNSVSTVDISNEDANASMFIDYGTKALPAGNSYYISMLDSANGRLFSTTVQYPETFFADCFDGTNCFANGITMETSLPCIKNASTVIIKNSTKTICNLNISNLCQ